MCAVPLVLDRIYKGIKVGKSSHIGNERFDTIRSLSLALALSFFNFNFFVLYIRTQSMFAGYASCQQTSTLPQFLTANSHKD